MGPFLSGLARELATETVWACFTLPCSIGAAAHERGVELGCAVEAGHADTARPAACAHLRSLLEAWHSTAIERFTSASGSQGKLPDEEPSHA